MYQSLGYYEERINVNYDDQQIVYNPFSIKEKIIHLDLRNSYDNCAPTLDGKRSSIAVTEEPSLNGSLKQPLIQRVMSAAKSPVRFRNNKD